MMNNKIFYLWLSLTMICSVCSAQKGKKVIAKKVQPVAIVKGTLENYKGKGYAIIVDENYTKSLFDTLHVQKDGSYVVKVKLDKPAIRGLYLEYLGEQRSVIPMYLVPGTTTSVTFKGMERSYTIAGEVQKQHLNVPTFVGPTKKECDFLNIPEKYDYTFKNTDGSAVTYKNYLGQLKARKDYLLSQLKGTRPEFAKQKEKEIDASLEGMKFTYAWQLKALNLDASKDADFMAYVNSINLNDEKNLESGDGGDCVLSNYIRFKLQISPDMYKDEPKDARPYCLIRDCITNQNIREKLSDQMMELSLAVGDNEALDRSFEVYKSISGKSESFKSNEKVYLNLTKLIPGVKATDFVMEDVNGNKVHFLDVIGKGKIVYIDFWATWCGPCCHEIPFVAEKVKKYKDNPNIEFISISLDDNKTKWHAKLDADKPSWRQFIIPENFNSPFALQYNITAIPRFMCFDKEAKIINISAPRPSDEAGFEALIAPYVK
jgi:thiol-disulfide isomerase/thioredoxin